MGGISRFVGNMAQTPTGMENPMRPVMQVTAQQQPTSLSAPAYPSTPMQVPVPSQVVQPQAGSQPQTMQGPAFLKQFGEGGGGMMNAVNPRAQFDASMYRRGGTPWQFGSQTAWAPTFTRQMGDAFQKGTMQPQAMPNLSPQQMQALAQMIAGMMRF